MSTPAHDWKARPEGGGLFALWLIRTIARRLGRRVARPLLWPITGYFLLKRGPERRASRAYLSRVLGRRAGVLSVVGNALRLRRTGTSHGGA